MIFPSPACSPIAGPSIAAGRKITSTNFNLAIENIDHTRTKAKSPQTNGICERFHKTVLDEFYQIAFRKRLYGSILELQEDLDIWLESYNRERTHQGRWCYGKTPMQTVLDSLSLAKEKLIKGPIAAIQTV